MAVYKAQFLASRSEAEHVASLLAETLDPPPAISASERPDGGLLVEIYFDDRPDPAVLSALGEGDAGAGALCALTVEAVPEEDWVAITQRGLHPIEAGRFFIHGSHDRRKARSRAYSIEIEAGQAFGTAHHGTTRGCLIMLDRLARKGRLRRVLDLGTGSGILAIAAAKALSDDILATDIDPVAIRVANENFADNGVARRVRGITAAGLHDRRIAARAPFELVIANILAGPLIAMAPGISRTVAPGGHLILSGLLDAQAREVGANYLARGFIIAARLSLEGWATLHVHRPGGQ